ncbi:MAG: hypothetical protein DBX46_03200 [Clostridiales bacterium]|nr:MAG: hypothetical protein DBX46_03200 [Clostridiales bacterium]
MRGRRGMGKRSLGILCILLAALCWGFLPLLTRSLSALGISPAASATMRALVAAVILVILGCAKKDSLRFSSSKMLIYMAVMGIFTTAGMYLFYMSAVDLLSTAMASMLLYTAPAFVILLSRIFYKEPITGKKLLCLILTLAGSALVVRIYDPASLFVNAAGIALGLASGVCYSLVTVMGRKALLYCSSTAVATWPVISGTLILVCITPPWQIDMSSPVLIVLYLLLGLIGSVLPLLLYNKGLALGVEGGQAGILATIEPVVATLTGVVAFGDVLEGLQIAGIASVLAGAALISFRKK